eukprot:3117208-Pyramimonas_sp.AAC.1
MAFELSNLRAIGLLGNAMRVLGDGYGAIDIGLRGYKVTGLYWTKGFRGIWLHGDLVRALRYWARAMGL